MRNLPLYLMKRMLAGESMFASVSYTHLRYVVYYRKVKGGIELIRVLSGYRDVAGLI